MKPVILGAGLAGLSTALALSPMPVILVSRCAFGDACSSAWAQGGVAAAVGPEDKPEYHAKDTLAAGVGLNDAGIVRQTTNDGPTVIERLISQGVNFDRDAQGNFVLGLEGAHGKRRVVHSTKDATGLAIMNALMKLARETPSIEIIEYAKVTELVVSEKTLTGIVYRQYGKDIALETPCAVLATGGAAALWRNTTNPHENWGSGLALAARSGALLGDLEFVQFHPTAIDINLDPMPLASEALRGDGSLLINENEERFVEELQPRDVVSRAIWDQISKGHTVYLDARKALGERFKERFPSIYEVCIRARIDPATMPIPVRPAAHYHMGGVLIDEKGRTNINGLWACGEVSCTGLHGANRLASNSLLEAASFGARVAADIQGASLSPKKMSPKNRPQAQEQDADKIRDIMSACVGVIRNAEGLKRAIDFLSPLAPNSDMALAGLMIAHAALKREESRGAHYRSDFPNTSAIPQRSRFMLSDLEDFPC